MATTFARWQIILYKGGDAKKVAREGKSLYRLENSVEMCTSSPQDSEEDIDSSVFC